MRRVLALAALAAATAFAQVTSIPAASSSSGGGGGSAYTVTSFSATPTFAVTASTAVQNFQITLTGNVSSSTLTTTSATSGQDIAFKVCQDATGSRTFVWPTNVVNPGSIPTTASTCGKQIFRFDGTNAVAFGPMTSDGATPGLQTPTGFLTLPAGTAAIASAVDFTSGASTVTNTGSDVTVYTFAAPALPAGGCYVIQSAVTLPAVGTLLSIQVDNTNMSSLVNLNGVGVLSAITYCNQSGVQNAQYLTYQNIQYGNLTGGSALNNYFPGAAAWLQTPTAVDWSSGHNIQIKTNGASGNTVGVYAHIWEH